MTSLDQDQHETTLLDIAVWVVLDLASIAAFIGFFLAVWVSLPEGMTP